VGYVKTKHLLLELMPDPVLVFGLDKEVEVIQVLDDESGTFTFVHGEQYLFNCRVAVKWVEAIC
jgi:hypothetical protein